MSEAERRLIRRIYDLWSREESARDLIAEDVEYVNPSYAVEPGTRRGRKSFPMVRDTTRTSTMKVERFIDTDGDDVVVLARYTASGRGSGVPLEGEHGYVWTVRDGQAVRFRWFQSHREALRRRRYMSRTRVRNRALVALSRVLTNTRSRSLGAPPAAPIERTRVVSQCPSLESH